MYPCPSCGLALPATDPPPSACPHCGVELVYDDEDANDYSDVPGAPPGFGGRPDESTEAPIFGMPGDSSAEMVRPDSLAPLRRRQPPPAAPPPGASSGPPSIGLEDLDRHGELDLGSSAGSLELDLRRRPSEPPPAIGLPEDSGSDFPAPVGLDHDALDLPSPVSASPGRTREDSNAYALDLPAPVQAVPLPTFGRPAAPPPATPPGGRAAPPATPGGRSAAPPAAPGGRSATPPAAPPGGRAAAPPAAPPSGRAAPPAAPPAGRSAAPPPAPPSGRAAPPAGGRPGAPPSATSSANSASTAAPAGSRSPGTPAPAFGASPGGARPAGPPPAELSFDDDLPVPVELDLPTPVADDRLDLPIPVDHAAAARSHDQMLTPVGLDVTPAQLDVTPVQLDVAPARLDVRPKLAGNEVAPHDLPGVRPERAPAGAPKAAPRTPSGPVAAASAASASKPSAKQASPAERAPRRPVSRGVILAAGGLLVVGLAGLGVLYSGILDPADPEPVSVRGGGGKKPAPKTEGGDGKQPDPKATPSAGPAERAPAVLAKLALHTPEAYVEAIAAARAAGDEIGAAEAALLLAHHYGPNPARVAEATAALSPHIGEKAGFVARVVGLGALLAGDLAGADAALTGDEPRTRLYRGWLRLAQGRLDDAEAEAKAVLAALPDEVGARHLALAVQAERDPAAAVPVLQAALDKAPHPALRALLAATATRTGQLAIARAAVDGLDPAATDDPGVQAWTHVQKAHVQAAQGDLGGAIAAFDRALELVPQAPATPLDRIRALVAAKRFSDASAAASALVRERPQDPEVKLLQADVAIQGGDGDVALQLLDALAAALPKDPRVSLGKGEVHAMRLEVDEGRAAFTTARELDPTSVRAAVGEAVMLADAKRLPDALAVLETARAAAEAAGRSRDVADLWLAKGKLHAKADERNAALEAFDRALAAFPGHNEAQLLRGILRLQAGQAEEGKADLVALFERTGGYPGLAAPLGRLYVRDGDFEALDRLVGDRLRGEPTPDELLSVGARLRLHQGRTADARALLELAIARHPADWEPHMLLAQVLILEGKAAEALAEIERARPPTPEPEHMLQRGKILEFNGRHDDAIPEYQRALGLDPELHEARFLYGRMLHYKGGHAKAIAELRKVLDEPRAKAAAWYPEVWLNIGVAQQAQGKHADAIESLEKATALDPELGEAWAKMGRFHGDRNEHAKAIAALEKAIEVGPKDAYWYPDALMDLGRAQSKSGSRADAKKSLEQFLELAPPDHTSRAEADRLLGEL